MEIPFAQAIRTKREQLGLSLQNLADLLGVSKSVVTKWERGERTPLDITQAGIWLRLSEWQAANGKKGRKIRGNVVAKPGEVWEYHGRRYLVGRQAAVSMSGTDDIVYWDQNFFCTHNGASKFADSLRELITLR